MTPGCEPNYSLLLVWHSRWNDVVLDTSSLLINSTVFFFSPSVHIVTTLLFYTDVT